MDFAHIPMYAVFLGSNPRMYAIRGLKFACINFHMFIGMVKEKLKDKKWFKGSKETAEGQGKGHTSVIHLEW